MVVVVTVVVVMVVVVVVSEVAIVVAVVVEFAVEVDGVCLVVVGVVVVEVVVVAIVLLVSVSVVCGGALARESRRVPLSWRELFGLWSCWSGRCRGSSPRWWWGCPWRQPWPNRIFVILSCSSSASCVWGYP